MMDQPIPSLWLPHHEEQLEARRVEFEALWKRRLEPFARCTFEDPRELATVHQAAWLAFVYDFDKSPL